MTVTYDKKPPTAAFGATLKEKILKNEKSAEPAIKNFLSQDISARLKPSLLDEDRTRIDILSNLLHPDGASCPECGLYPHVGHLSFIKNFYTARRCACPSCGHQFTARSGTILQGSQLSHSQVFLMSALIDLMHTGITPSRIASMVGVSVDTVRNWMKKFKVIEGAYGK